MRVAAVAVARNEEEMIEATLRSLLDQSIPVDVVLVDDGSTDDTPFIGEGLGVPVIRLPPHRESYVGRPELALRVNIGVSYSRRFRPDYVMHTGGDHILPPCYCESLINQMVRDDAVVASGSIREMKRNYTAPLGSGRMIDAAWWDDVSRMAYPVHPGWESWLIYKARMTGYETRCYREPTSKGRPVAMNLQRGNNNIRGGHIARLFHPNRHHRMLRLE